MGFNPIKKLQKKRLDKQWEKLNDERNSILEGGMPSGPGSRDKFFAREEKRKNIEHQIKQIEQKLKKLK